MLPLARVFALSARAPAPLAELLAQHGYRIEIVNPDEQRTPGAEEECQLEVSIEQLAPRAAVERAQYLAERLGCDVIVASGALAGLRPVENEPEPQIAEPAIADVADREMHSSQVFFEVVSSAALEDEPHSAESGEVAQSAIPAPAAMPEPRPRRSSFWQVVSPYLHRSLSAAQSGVRIVARNSAAGVHQFGTLSAGAARGLRHRFDGYVAERRAKQAAAAAEGAKRQPLPPVELSVARSAVVEAPRQIEPRRFSRERDWQMAVAGAAIMATIIMFALGVFSNSLQSSSPAAKIIAQPAARLVGPAVVSASTLAPQASAPAKRKPALMVSSSKPRPSTVASIPNDDDDQDVVVRHFAATNAPKQDIASKTSAGVKQYSDLQ